MAWDNPRFSFPKAEQYAFVFDNAHLLLLAWERDNAKFLFLIKEQNEGGLSLDYPGKLFTDRVLDIIENIFFVQVQEAETAETKKYVLGSYFEWGERHYGAYYERDVQNPNVVLFRIDGEAPDQMLDVIEGDEYVQVANAFAQQHANLIDIERANA